MKDVSQVTALVFGHGLEIPIAERLARDCKRVLYFSEWQEGVSTIKKAIIGDGIPNVERCLDIWEVKDEIDLWVFPDIGHSGLQLELESQGFPVWGSRRGDSLEIDREKFLRVLGQVGLDVPSFEVVEGITALREHLKESENVFIKISKYRGSLETRHWRSWRLDENLLDIWSIRFGAARETIRFLVFDAIETELEIGGDSYSVDGKWPLLMLHGIEAKDAGYFAAVTKRGEMPEPIQEISEAFAPVLEKYRYRNEFSMEVRVKGEEAFFIDPTCRLGLPSTGSQLELWENFSEIVWAGAHGKLVEPQPTAKFSAELILKAKSDGGLWPTIEIDPELRQWLKLADYCVVNGLASWPREDSADDSSVGWLVAIGDSPRETLETIKERVKLLPEGLTADVAPLAEIIEEIEVEEEQGIKFTEKEMPEPAEVIE